MAGDGRMRRTLMTALAGVLLVGGCTGDPEPVTTPGVETPTVSPTPSPSPTPTPLNDLSEAPERPEAMGGPGVDGAKAAVTYFLELYPYVYATGDTEAWRGMSAETCEFCLESAADAEALVASGTRGGTPLEIVSIDGTELKPEVWYSVRTRIVQPPTFETHPSGRQVQKSDGGTYDFDFALTWADGRWIVDSVGIEPVGAS